VNQTFFNFSPMAVGALASAAGVISAQTGATIQEGEMGNISLPSGRRARKKRFLSLAKHIGA
jgi:hypothetical protein